MDFNKYLNLETVTPESVYNLQLFECYLLIDLRPAELYTKGHIASALNYPPPKDEETITDNLVKFVTWADNNTINERWSPIILYGDDELPDVEYHLLNFARTIQEYFVTESKKKLRSEYNTIMKIAKQCKALWKIKGGYIEFEKKYEFLCGTWDSSLDGFGANTLVPLPIDVTSAQSSQSYHVLLGSRVIVWTSDMLKKFFISRIICDKENAESFADILVDSGILTMVCDIPDESHGEKIESLLFPLWNKTSSFISEGLDLQLNLNSENYVKETTLTTILNNKNNYHPNRVLIHLHGRSRSASIAVAWLMKQFSFQHQRAIEDIIFSAPGGLVDLTLMYSHFLINWQKSGYGGMLLEDIK